MIQPQTSKLFRGSSLATPFLFRGQIAGAKKKKQKQKQAIEASNTLFSKATARIVEMVSQGEIVGLVGGAKGIYFDDIPLQNADGSFNFDGVTWDERTGTPDQLYMEGFPSTEDEETVGIQLRKNGTMSDTGLVASSAGLTVTYPTAQAVGDIPQKITISNIVGGPATFTITNKTNTGFFIRFKSGGTFVGRTFDYVVEDVAIFVVQQIIDPELDAIRVHLRTPVMISQDSSGDVRGFRVSVAIDIQPFGGSYTTVKTVKIEGKCTSPYEESHRVELPIGGAPWNIRCRRISPETGTSKVVNDVYWSGYTKINDVKITYEDYAVIGIILDASYFGEDIPVRSFRVKGRILQVPSNYDPTTRIYTGIWDGTFKPAWSDNPVWVYYDLLTHKRYGLGHRIKPENVDKWTLYTIAQYCDELVDDGAGGLEPRYTFNGVISDQEEAYTVLNAVAASFMSMIYWGTDTVTTVQDSPKAVSRVVSPANVIDGIFNYSGTALKARATVVYVTWNDPKNNYKQRITVVEDPELINKWGYRQKDVALVGCTSPGLAYRMGKMILESEKRQTDTVTYVAGLDHADARPGDVHLIQDPSYAGLRMGGRLKSVVGTTVELDAPIDLPDGTNTIYAVLQNGTVEGRNITTPTASGVDTLEIAVAFSKPIVPGAMWTVATSNLVPRQFRVLSVAEDDKTQFEITALLHDPTKYTFVEDGVIIPTTPTTTFGPLPAPSTLSFKEYLYQMGGLQMTGVFFGWEAPKDNRVRYYEAAYMREGETSWQTFSRTDQLGVDIKPTTLGISAFRVRSMDRYGVVSPWKEITYNLLGAYAAPSNVTGLVAYILEQTVVLSWDESVDGDIAYYQIRFVPRGSTLQWIGATPLVNRVAGTTATVPFLDGTYIIKAFDTVGSESDDFASLEINSNLLPQLNVVESISHQPLWVDTKTDTQIVAPGYLTLADEVPDQTSVLSGSYETAWVDLTEIYLNKVTVTLDIIGDVLGDNLASWPVLANLTSMASSDLSSFGVKVFIQYTDDDPNAAPVVTPYQEILLSNYQFRACRFRLDLTSVTGATRPLIRKFRAVIDMPDRTEGEQNVTVPTGGIDISYGPAYKVAPALVVDCKNLLDTEKKIITNETVSGFHVEFQTGGGSPIAKTINWVAEGYGRVITPAP